MFSVPPVSAIPHKHSCCLSQLHTCITSCSSSVSTFSFHRRPCRELSHSSIWSQTPDSCSAPHGWTSAFCMSARERLPQFPASLLLCFKEHERRKRYSRATLRLKPNPLKLANKRKIISSSYLQDSGVNAGQMGRKQEVLFAWCFFFFCNLNRINPSRPVQDRLSLSNAYSAQSVGPTGRYAEVKGQETLLSDRMLGLRSSWVSERRQDVGWASEENDNTLKHLHKYI